MSLLHHLKTYLGSRLFYSAVMKSSSLSDDFATVRIKKGENQGKIFHARTMMHSEAVVCCRHATLCVLFFLIQPQKELDVSIWAASRLCQPTQRRRTQKRFVARAIFLLQAALLACTHSHKRQRAMKGERLSSVKEHPYHPLLSQKRSSLSHFINVIMMHVHADIKTQANRQKGAQVVMCVCVCALQRVAASV